MSTPKQAAARLLLAALDQGKAPAQMSREDMATALGERVSDQKREKILEFAGKITARPSATVWSRIKLAPPRRLAKRAKLAKPPSKRVPAGDRCASRESGAVDARPGVLSAARPPGAL